MSSIAVGDLTIRPLRSGDAGVVCAVFSRLSPRSRALRFAGTKPRLSDAEVGLLTIEDGRRHAVVAWAAGDPDPVGIARLVRDGDEADVACAVADDYQHRGVGTALMQTLAADARAAGIRRLRATIVSGNNGGLAVLRRVAHIDSARVDGGTIEVEATLV